MLWRLLRRASIIGRQANIETHRCQLNIEHHYETSVIWSKSISCQPATCPVPLLCSIAPGSGLGSPLAELDLPFLYRILHQSDRLCGGFVCAVRHRIAWYTGYFHGVGICRHGRDFFLAWRCYAGAAFVGGESWNWIIGALKPYGGSDLSCTGDTGFPTCVGAAHHAP